MPSPEICRQRLYNQGLLWPARESPAEVVDWLVAVQSQDYLSAKWAVGARMRSATDADLDRAFAQGSILRTHVLRPTWHFVTPADIRWLLELTAPRVHATNGTWYRRLGLDARMVRRSQAALVKALGGGRHRTRDELRHDLQAAGIATEGLQRMAYILMRAELDRVICSGPRRGKQFTYALLDERAPEARRLDRPEALAELARRYFASRGPASDRDFAKWAGLNLADARAGLEAVRPALTPVEVDGRTCWGPEPEASDVPASTGVLLLSIYDEYVSSYHDRRAMVTDEYGVRLQLRGNALTAVLVVDGLVFGTWKRTLGKSEVTLEVSPFGPLTRHQARALEAEAERYGRFLGLPVELRLTASA
jgi:hypothetical protein